MLILAEGLPKDLKGYELEKKSGGLIKKLILLIIVALVLMYFFKREWFNMVIDYVTGFF